MRDALALAVLLAANLGQAAPPVPSVTELTAPVGKPTPLTVTVEKGKKLGTEKTYNTASLMLARLWSDDANTYEYWVFPNEAGTYYVPFWTEGETKGIVVKIVTGGKPTDPPVKDPPPKDPPKDPPVVTPKEVLYFMVVLPPGGVSKEHETIMNLSGWDAIRQAGHSVAAFPADKMPTGWDRPATVPTVMVLRRNPGGVTWADTGKNRPFPTTNEDIRGLLK